MSGAFNRVQSIAYPTEVRSFNSLQELSTWIEKTLQNYAAKAKDYGDRLGSLLRVSEQDKAKAEWTVELSQKLNAKAQKPDAKGKVKKGAKEQSEWVTFQKLMLYTGDALKGEAEIYFEALENLNQQISRLKDLIKALAELGEIGLGNVTYIAYMQDGVLEKIILCPRGNETARFEFKGMLSIR